MLLVELLLLALVVELSETGLLQDSVRQEGFRATALPRLERLGAVEEWLVQALIHHVVHVARPLDGLVATPQLRWLALQNLLEFTGTTYVACGSQGSGTERSA